MKNQPTRPARRRLAAAGALSVLAALAASAWAADDPCDSYAWKVAQERRLFAGEALALASGADAATASRVDVGRLYAIALLPIERIRFGVAPGRAADAGNPGGALVRLRVETAGDYRVDLDQPLWVDVVLDGRTLEATAFQGRAGCRAPRKMVRYPLPAGRDLLLQFSGAASGMLHLAITREAQDPPR